MWFACDRDGAKHGNDRAIVRAVSWAGQESGAKVACLLAPPFVRNLYKQRGLFLKLGKNDELTGKLSLDVRFPVNTAIGKFKAFRDQKQLHVFGENELDEKELVKWSRGIAGKGTNAREVSEIVKAVSGGDLPEFYVSQELWNSDKMMTNWYKMLDWVLPATCVTARGKPPPYYINDSKVKSLVNSNETFFRSIVEDCKDLNALQFPVTHDILKIAKRELGIS